VGSYAGLAFTGEAGVIDVKKFFRTRVRGFSYISDDVSGVFRDFQFGFRENLIVSVGEKRRVYI
jgi:hypothetical protein